MLIVAVTSACAGTGADAGAGAGAGAGKAGLVAGRENKREVASSREDVQRLHVAREIESTEQSYLHRLRALRDVYVVGFYAKALGPESLCQGRVFA